jgi:hypothetical protein
MIGGWDDKIEEYGKHKLTRDPVDKTLDDKIGA